MDFHYDKKNDAMVVVPGYERLDAMVAQDFRDQVIAEAGHVSRIVLDLSGMKFIDSSGLGAMVAVVKRLDEGNLRLANVSGHIHMLLRLTRLDQVFSVFEDVESALQG